ncbi:hypothetical protein HY993_02810 [Candidatus Micrarchaeota archaeon]|nr:hypothetical protein [Candidatus Micrarchaeota archaeon]
MVSSPAIICDSSSLISFAETCNIEAFYFLKDFLHARFFVPPRVRSESVTDPLKIKKYEFSAVRLNKLLEDNVVSLISVPNLARDTVRVMDLANNSFFIGGKPLKLIQSGEAECLAVIIGAKMDAFLIDEKTTRLLIENPRKLEEQLRLEYSRPVFTKEENISAFRALFSKVKVIRSTELLAVAAKNGFFAPFKENESHALHSALYSLKTAGCSITERELTHYFSIRV